MAGDPNFTSDNLLRLIDTEEAMIHRRLKQGLLPIAHPSSAFPASTARDRQRPICSNCKRTNHATDFCILPGGKMAGRSIDKARAAQRAPSGKPPRGSRPHSSQTAHVATIAVNADVTETPSVPHPSPFITINGISYVLEQPRIPL